MTLRDSDQCTACAHERRVHSPGRCNVKRCYCTAFAGPDYARGRRMNHYDALLNEGLELILPALLWLSRVVLFPVWVLGWLLNRSR